MRTFIGSLILVLGITFTAGAALAADPMKEKEAKPSMKERIMESAVKGTLMKIDGEYYMIKDTDGKEHKVHVDKSTKLDTVKEGDMVKAYVTDKGHVTTLKRHDK